MIPADTISNARTVRIEAEAERRGIKLRGNIERVGPCPVCGGTDRFGINVRKQMFNCRGCRQGGKVIAMVQLLDGCGFAQAIETLAGESPRAINPRHAQPLQRDDDYEKRQAAKASYLWAHRRPIAGTPAETYLREARRYDGPLPTTLGFLPPSKPEHCPAMIAAFGMPEEPEPGILGDPRGVNAVHLTLLTPDGGKADVKPNKLIIGRPLGRPIVLAPVNDLLGLAITEGIEDALSVHVATGLGAWAAGAASFMPTLADTVPDYIEAVTIYAHRDPAGQNGARRLAQALTDRGIEVFVEGLLYRSLTNSEVIALMGGDR